MSVDIFVSYAGPDRPWAEWVASQVEAAGLSVELDAWDWAAGSNFVLNMNDALARASRVVALYSKAYFERSRYTTEEWAAAVAARQRLLPLRVEEVEPPPILRPLIWVDLFGVEEAHARARVRRALRGPTRPSEPALFPGAEPAPPDGVRVPGSLPAVWNVPPRLRAFTGRRALLAALRERLTSGERAVVQALYGMGGVGKTQLAIEYAHLFAGDYDLVWWVDAERAELIGEQFATLGLRAGWVKEGTADAAATAAVMDRLRGMSRWLLVFDNAESAADLKRWLPARTGHTVITSRSGAFAAVAVPVEVDVFTRAESIELVRQYLPPIRDADADMLAEALGDLPLALAQAAGLMEETRIPVAGYLAELKAHARDLMAEGQAHGYPISLAATVDLAVRRLSDGEPAAVELLHMCAHLAPEPIPLAWFEAAPADVLGGQLAAVAAAPMAFHRTLGRLARLGLVRLTEETIQLHRLTQAVLRERRIAEDRDRDRQRVERLLANARPAGDSNDPKSWPAWAVLLPHVLALEPAEAGPELRETALNGLWYLLMRGDYGTALPRATHVHQRWAARLGEDHRDTLMVAAAAAMAHQYAGQYAKARALNEETLARCRRVLGEDDGQTLGVANNLADNLRALGEYEKARALDEDNLARRRQTFDEDHPSTLTAANGLAIDLWHLGELEEARALAEDILTRRQRVLGENHPNTLRSAQILGLVFRGLREYERARALDEATLTHLRHVLGPDHPETLVTANNLALTLRDLGRTEEARALSEETFARLSILSPDHPDTFISALNLALVLRDLGHTERAEALEKEVEERRKALES